MGTKETWLGKSLAEMTAVMRRHCERGVRRTLIVGPKYPLQMTWDDEITEKRYVRPSMFDKQFNSQGYYIPLASGELIWRAAVIRDLIAGAAGNWPVIVTINFEALDDYFEEIVKVEDGYRFRKKIYPTLREARVGRANSTSKRIVDLLLDWKPEDVIVDEAHLVASAGAQRSRALRRLGRGAQYVRLLSGTPDPKRALSFYSQYVVLDPGIFGTNKAKFLDEYFSFNHFTGLVEGLKPSAERAFYDKVFSVMSRVRAEDYFGPNEPNTITRHIPWPARAGKLYTDFQKDHVLAEDDLSVDGTHLLTKLLRSLQLCAGFLEDEASGEQRWIHHAKTEAITADLAEPIATGLRVVVSYTFTSAGVAVTDAINAAYGKGTAVLINGQTKDAASIMRLFDVNCTTPTDIKVLVIQERVGGVGISLARARHLFFHSWSMDSAAHDQMLHRIWMPNRTSNITYFQMKHSADKYARMIVRDKLDASVMLRKIGLANALAGGPFDIRPEFSRPGQPNLAEITG